LSETDKLLEAMRIALFKQDYVTFRELAHILKGSAGNVGAEVLFTTCRHILQLGEADLKNSASALLKEALDSYPSTRVALQRHLNDANQAAM
jgi:two-component system sensor histidine kinase RpfC